VGFVVKKVALGQVLLQVLQFSPVSIIAQDPHTQILALNNRPFGDRSSKT
jgi:branched-subunit amino acid transport protein